tara:strand:- start:3211 stop:3786 length:576 start_codon:yes stop_codon:yes gene_type:complete
MGTRTVTLHSDSATQNHVLKYFFSVEPTVTSTTGTTWSWGWGNANGDAAIVEGDALPDFFKGVIQYYNGTTYKTYIIINDSDVVLKWNTSDPDQQNFSINLIQSDRAGFVAGRHFVSSEPARSVIAGTPNYIVNGSLQNSGNFLFQDNDTFTVSFEGLSVSSLSATPFFGNVRSILDSQSNLLSPLTNSIT